MTMTIQPGRNLRVRWRLLAVFAGAALCAGAASADDAGACSAAGGHLLAGTVASAPRFAHGQFKKGVELSHTHLNLRGDVVGLAVVASGYVKNAKGVPAPLNAIAVGDRLEACGIPFKGGIHWVHDNCGDKPTAQDPDGWLKKLGAGGAAGENMESGTGFCYLWPKKH